MTEETAREAVEFMLRESGTSPMAYLTFFGGETLMNFPVLKRTVGVCARTRAAEVGKEVQFSLTTNATLLVPEIIDFLADNDIGVTISIDGPPEIQDKFRVFSERPRQLRPGGAEGEGAARAAQDASDRRARDARGGNRRA